MLKLPLRRLRPVRRNGRRGRWAAGPCREGVSLPELLVVMGILGLMGMIVAPAIEIERFRLDGAARGSAAALVSAQRLAVQRQHDVVVAFDTAGVRILIHEDADNDGAVDGGERVRTVALDERVRFGRGSAPPRSAEHARTVGFDEVLNGMPAFRFVRSGSASQEGSFYLTSARSVIRGGYAEDARAVQVERATGRVTWFRFEPPEWTREQ